MGSARNTHHAPAGHGRGARAPVFPAHVVGLELVVDVLVDLVVSSVFLTSSDEPASELGTSEYFATPLKVQREFGCRAHLLLIYISFQAGLAPGGWTRASLERASYVRAPWFGK